MHRTCLFTGAALPADNKPEHPIPGKLGGKLACRTVTSGELNNGTSRFDEQLTKTYRVILDSLTASPSVALRCWRIR